MTPDEAVDVTTMWQAGKYQYTETDLAQTLAMPYEGKDLSMVILLPKAVDGLRDLERALTGESLASWTRDMALTDVKIWLPRFQTTCEFNLSDVLKNMGMVSAFGPGADFSKMTRTEGLLIGGVMHKAFVGVTENGTEASAATAVEVHYLSTLPQDPKVFRADHPFLFLIQDTRTGAVLFLGRIVDPRS
ncbi:MAG: serpin family protein [bacterium]|nr:serpin family protein [bacterium]